MILQYPHVFSPIEVLPHLGWPVVVLIVVGIVVVALRWWMNQRTVDSAGVTMQLNQHAVDFTGVTMQRRPLMTRGELAFFAALETAVSSHSRVFVQVPLAALIDVRASDRSAQATAFNQIDRKRVDFVLADPKSLEVQAVVELDDSSHLLEGRRSRDEIVEDALKKAGIKIIRFPVQASYNSDQIWEKISKALA